MRELTVTLLVMGVVLTALGAQALAKYAFGLGTVTMVACTLVFTGMSLPPGQGLGTQIMVKASGLAPDMSYSGVESAYLHQPLCEHPNQLKQR